MHDHPKIRLVLCPGLLCDRALWEAQIAALSDIAECWVPDLTRQETMQAMGEAVLRDAPWPSFALAGLSMGGYVALETLRQAPARIERLALLDTRARPEQPEESERRLQLMKLAQAEGNFTPVNNRMMPFLVHPSRIGEPGLTQAICAMADRVGLQAYLRQQKAIMSRPDFRPGLGAIRVPTLVLCGREDRLTPLDCSEEMAEAIAGADLAVLGRCGHMSTMERPQAVNSALRGWLQTA